MTDEIKELIKRYMDLKHTLISCAGDSEIGEFEKSMGKTVETIKRLVDVETFDIINDMCVVRAHCDKNEKKYPGVRSMMERCEAEFFDSL